MNNQNNITDSILDKLLKITKEIEVRKKEDKVLIMHYSTAYLLKDFISYKSDFYKLNNNQSNIFICKDDFKIEVFLSPKIKKYNFAFISRNDYELFFNN